MERSKTLAKQDQEHVELIFFSPLFAFSVLVHLRTVSLLHCIRLSRIMYAIQAQHFEPLLYSTVYGPKSRKLFTLYVKRVSLLSSQPWLVDLNTQHSVTKELVSHNHCGFKYQIAFYLDCINHCTTRIVGQFEVFLLS